MTSGQNNRWTAGSATPWLVGATLGLLLGLLLLIAVPRLLGRVVTPAPAATATTNSGTPGTASAGAGASGAQAPGATSPETTASTAAEGAPAVQTEASGSAGTPAAVGNADAGQQVFASTCAGCHGANAQGGVGPTLEPVTQWSLEQFGAAVHQGKAPDRELNAVMPRYTEAQVSPQQLADVHTFLEQTFNAPTGAATETADPDALVATATGAVVPATDHAQGKAVFDASCASCHQAQGNDGIDPNLEYAARWTEEQFILAMREGKAPEKVLGSLSPRLTGGQVSTTQLRAVHQFLQATFKTAAATPATTPAAEAAPAGAVASASTSADAEAGKVKFAGTCGGCHGMEAQGGMGPALGVTKDWTDAQFTAAVREGKAPEKTLGAVMPHFTVDQVSDAEMANFRAFLNTVN